MLGTIFHRPARIYPDRLPEDEIVFVAPPATPQAQQGATSWLQYVIPVVGSLGSIAFVFAYGGSMAGRSPVLTFLIPGVAVLTAGLSIFGGVAMRRSQKKAFEKQVKTNRERYTTYVETQANRLDAIARAQRAVGTRLHPDLPDLAGFVARREYVWERRITDADFLLTRAGTGPIPLAAPVRIETGSNPLMDYDQECLSRARSVVARYSQVENAPIAVPLRDAGTLAVSGNRGTVRALVRSMLVEIAAFHSPDDLRILAYFPPDAAAEWGWLKWLPHTHRLRQMKADKTTGEPMCLLADSVENLRDLLNSQVLPELERRRKLAGEKNSDHNNATPPRPHFVIVLDGFTPQGPLARTPLLNELFREAASLGVTVLCLVDDRSEEPAALQARLEVSGVGWLSFQQTASGGKRVEGIHPDAADAAACEQVARDLAPLTLGEKGASRDLADDVKLLDLYGISSPDALDVAKLWQPRSRQDLLRVPIGMRADGEPLILDVKEAADGGMGVHGLIIGATGSGKSELLRTIVTSLALTHDPETLNFVLADFKGGASFADLANLPHAAGMITNLASDLTLVDRMKAALAGEQERRQRMLREAGNLDNIKQYQAKRAMTPGMEPMPYLMIIVDEFAELLANRPDFLELFVAIGRVGRSLGMHLLLATQRLGEGRISGLEGHLRYRICLRTFSAAESSAVLNTPDAFYLPSFPGIGYFKVDTNIYDMFKTALVSTPYVPASENTATTLTVRSFGATGRLLPLISSAPSSDAKDEGVRSEEGDALKTDMDVIITHLVENETAQEQRAGVHQVWLPPLPTRLTLTELLRTGGLERLDGSRWAKTPACGTLRVPVGLLDKPVEQAQQPLLLDFSGAGGHLALVGAPQSGKSTLLQALITSFAVTHSPRDVQFYCVDLGGGLLRQLEGLPHVGAVCGKTERDKLRRMIRQMRTIIEEREYLFRERRIDNIMTYRQMRQAGELADVPFGDVFLIIDDLAQLQAEFEGIDAELVEIVMSGLAYGVHVIVASSRWPDVRPKLRDNIGTRLELRLNDPVESEIGKAAALSLPVNAPGRGLIKGGLQFQTALAWVDAYDGQTPQTLPEAIEALAARMRAAWSGPVAPPIRMLPALVPARDLPEPGPGQPAGVPIGLEEFQLDAVFIDLMAAGPHFLAFGDGESGKTNLLRHWINELERRYTPEQARFALVDFRRNLLDFLGDPHLFTYACTPPMLKECVEKLKGELDGRMLGSANLTIEELRNPKKWAGPHYFLFVDDYESLVTPAGNPLAPLADLIAQAKDVGFHVVLARKVAGTSRTAFEAVFQRLRETGSPGLVMNGDPQEGPLLGTQRASALPSGRGYLVRRNQRTTLVQVAYAEPRAAEAAG